MAAAHLHVIGKAGGKELNPSRNISSVEGKPSYICQVVTDRTSVPGAVNLAPNGFMGYLRQATLLYVSSCITG